MLGQQSWTPLKIFRKHHHQAVYKALVHEIFSVKLHHHYRLNLQT